MSETNGHPNGDGKARVPERFRGILARPEATGLEIEAAFAWAVRDAVAAHKRDGDPIAVWEDGRVVIIQPEDIPDFPNEEDATDRPENKHDSLL